MRYQTFYVKTMHVPDWILIKYALFRSKILSSIFVSLKFTSVLSSLSILSWRQSSFRGTRHKKLKAADFSSPLLGAHKNTLWLAMLRLSQNIRHTKHIKKKSISPQCHCFVCLHREGASLGKYQCCKYTSIYNCIHACMLSASHFTRTH